VKIAYIFSTSGHTASYKLGKMILPQLEEGSHGVEVAARASSSNCARRRCGTGWRATVNGRRSS
jgi:hypothetical protein